MIESAALTVVGCLVGGLGGAACWELIAILWARIVKWRLRMDWYRYYRKALKEARAWFRSDCLHANAAYKVGRHVCPECGLKRSVFPGRERIEYRE